MTAPVQERAALALGFARPALSRHVTLRDAIQRVDPVSPGRPASGAELAQIEP